MSGKRGRTDAARESLLRRAEKLLRTERPAAAVPGASANRFSDDAVFRSLPGYEEIRLYQEIGRSLGIPNPYFRLHEGRAGARTRIGGREILNFSSYDYLGLNGHPEIMAVAKEAIDRYGISPGASRCVAGERSVHRNLERALAEIYGAEDCCVFVSGWATNLGVIGQIVDSRDLLISDSIVHNSAITGAVLSGAQRRSFPHNDLDALEMLLAETRGKFRHALIVIEGLYGMDGDYVDLPRLLEIKRRYDAWLMVDEAHALGVIGERGFGIAERFGIDPTQVEIWMGTLSKALVACGGYIAGTATLIDYLKNTVGAFVYSVAMPPVIAATAEKALEIMRSEPARVARLRENAVLFRKLAKEAGLDVMGADAVAVAPVIVQDTLLAVVLSEQLLQSGINVMPVMYPAVPANGARLRFFLTAAHTASEIRRAVETTANALRTARERAQELRHSAVASRLRSA